MGISSFGIGWFIGVVLAWFGLAKRDQGFPLPVRTVIQTFDLGEEQRKEKESLDEFRRTAPYRQSRTIAVDPAQRRRGIGRALLQEAEAALRTSGATGFRVGGDAPRYLWPGVDVTDLGLLALLEAAGYDSTRSVSAASTEFWRIIRAGLPSGPFSTRKLTRRSRSPSKWSRATAPTVATASTAIWPARSATPCRSMSRSSACGGPDRLSGRTPRSTNKQ